MTRLTKINLLYNKNKNLFINNKLDINICNLYIKTKDLKTIYYHDNIINDNLQRVSIIYNNNCCVTIIASSIDDIFNK